MADLNDINSAQSVKVIGSDSSGVEQTPVNSTAAGGLHINLRDNSGNEIATTTNPAHIDGNVANAATDAGNPVKIGGKYTTTTPVLTTGQRGDLQLDENGNSSTIQSYANYTDQKKTYVASTIATLTVGTSETAIYLFKNPNASGKKCKIFKGLFNLGGTVTYRFYHTPTITTNGTAITPINQRISSSPPVAVATPFYSPTVSSNGTYMFQYASSAQTSTDEIEFAWQPTIDPNFNLLITAQAGSNNTPLTITLIWNEL